MPAATELLARGLRARRSHPSRFLKRTGGPSRARPSLMAEEARGVVLSIRRSPEYRRLHPLCPSTLAIRKWH